ncbi:MAG: MFS transporter [Deltaproteobacteria bacterium]|nr:MFS transporter [Deltaproteobacteria bacterium]
MQEENGTRPGAWTVLSLASLGFMLSMFYRVSAAVISPELSRELALDSDDLGQLSAAFFYAFALCQVPVGLAMDRWGARVVMSLFSLAGVAGAVCFALAGGVVQAWWGRALLGVGMSTALMGSLALVAGWFAPWQFATLTGLIVAAGQAGQLMAATPLAWLTETLGWRGAFWVVAAFHLVQLAGFFLVVRDRPPGRPALPRGESNPLSDLRHLLSKPVYWMISLGTFMRYGAFMSILALWAGPFLMGGLGLGPVEVGNMLVLSGVGYMVALPWSGRLSDRVLRSRKLVIWPSFFMMGGLTAALAWLEQGVSLWLLGLWFFLFGVSAAPGQIMYAHIRELMPARLSATAMTGINIFTMLGPAAMMQLTGALVAGDPAGQTGPEAFRPVWWVLTAGVLLAGVVYSLTPDSRLAADD